MPDVSYEIHAGDTVISLVDNGVRVSVTASEGPLEVTVTRSIRGAMATTTATSGTGNSISFPVGPLSDLIEQSDLPEPDKREARTLLQRFKVRPTLGDIATILVIVDKSEPLRTQLLHVLGPFFTG